MKTKGLIVAIAIFLILVAFAYSYYTHHLSEDLSTSTQGNNNSDYEVIDNPFNKDPPGITENVPSMSNTNVNSVSMQPNVNEPQEYKVINDTGVYTPTDQPLIKYLGLKKDPSNPSNFLYNRQISSPLRNANSNESDMIRGDLRIAPIKTGWFDTPANPATDLTVGYFNTP